MLPLKLPQQFRLLLLVARRQSRLLLSLIPHHLFHHAPCLAIQIPQFRVLRLDLRDVDFWRGGDDVRPPFQLVNLIEVDVAGFEAGGDGG